MTCTLNLIDNCLKLPLRCNAILCLLIARRIGAGCGGGFVAKTSSEAATEMTSFLSPTPPPQFPEAFVRLLFLRLHCNEVCFTLRSKKPAI